jgi:hypothetical protein
MIEVGIQPFFFQKLFVSGMGFGTVCMLDDTALIQNQDHIRAQGKRCRTLNSELE